MKLFDKQEAIKLLRGKCVAKYPSTFTMGLFAAADEIAKLPEVDAAPVVLGEWVAHDFDMAYECSACGYITEWHLSKYCPECGAKMRRKPIATSESNKALED